VLYTADAYGKDGKRFTVLADDKLTAFLKLERQVLMKGEKGLPPATHVVESSTGIIADNLSKAGWSWGCVNSRRLKRNSRK
jgi:hypothetical protein